MVFSLGVIIQRHGRVVRTDSHTVPFLGGPLLCGPHVSVSVSERGSIVGLFWVLASQKQLL